MYGSGQNHGRGGGRGRGFGDGRGRGGGGGRGRGQFQQRDHHGNNFRGRQNNNNPRYNSQRENDDQNTFKEDGIAYKQIEQMCADMDSMKVLSGSSDILKFVQNKSFKNRLNNLWPEIEKQTKFLKIIVATASSSQADVHPLTLAFLDDVLSSKVIDTVVEKFSPFPYSIELQKNPHCLELVGYVLKLLLLGFESLPSKMDIHLTKVQLIIAILNGLPNFLNDEILFDLEGLQQRIKDRYTEKAEKDKEELQAQREQKRKCFEDIHGTPPNNFRELSLIPTPEDIDPKNTVFLRPAKIIGPYDSDEHYLDVQFRLLREDLIQPLREGIESYQYRGTKKTNLYVYSNVSLEPAVMDQKTGELAYYAKIQLLKRMNKRFLFGSLVCLSPDDFRETFIFATVLERDSLKHGKVGLKLEGNYDVNINTKLKYRMVESPALYVSYSHVMEALKTLPRDIAIPFSRYLVDVETNVNIPKYLETKPINFEVLFTDKLAGRRYRPMPASIFHHSLTPDHFGMDQSQFNALVHTLNSDLAIIQGPPGTGKTYMGLQIAKLLLSNYRLWQSTMDPRPILVVCYTNHALDQFLEGISLFMNNGIVRVGSQCKNENLEKYMINNLRTWKDPQLKHDSKDLRTEISDLAEQHETSLDVLKELQTRFANPKHLHTNYSNPELPYYESCKNLGTKIEDFDITVMSSWLTYHSMTVEYPFDVRVIKYLIHRKIPEIQAKNALWFAYGSEEDFDAQSLYQSLKDGDYGEVSTTELLDEIHQWPNIADIKELERQGFDTAVAVEILMSSQNNMEVVNEELELARNFIGNRKPAAAPELPEQQAPEDVADIDIAAEDDSNRMIFDNNFMQEIIGKKKKTKKVNEIWFDKDSIKPYLKHIVNAPSMQKEEADNITDIWEIPLQARWRLYQGWISKVLYRSKARHKQIEQKFSKCVKQHQALKLMADADVMKRAKVVGMTTTAAARLQSTLRTLRPRIVIVEEAAEVLEAHLLASLTIACEHLILIGDHKQLRPSVQVHHHATKYNMDVSLFERLVKNNFPYRMLQNQHRMCTDISRPLMPHFYEDLLDHPSVFKRKSIKGVTKNLFFITHSEPEVCEKDNKSHSNPFEAEYALKLARYYLQQGYKGSQITILCTYMEQLLILRTSALKIIGEIDKVTIQTVDNYQGEESDIIILSLVRSDNPEGRIGFLRTPNRVCVALSRARRGLYVICNMEFLSRDCEMWQKIKRSIEHVGVIDTALTVKCQIHQTEQFVASGEDFDKKCPEGGCDEPCNTLLNCGHTCPKPCHVEDPDHLYLKCYKPCARTCSSSKKHPCAKRCHQECGECEITVKKLLLCGHIKKDKCCRKPESIKCINSCEKVLTCGHPCTEKCSVPCTSECEAPVQKTLPKCGHDAMMKCCDDPNTIECKTVVRKKWPFCDHTVKTYCYVDVSTTPCPNPCKVPLPGCEHLCKGKCGSCRNGRLHIRCTEKCKKILICGHECESNCSDTCPPCQKLCQTACAHSKCGKKPLRGRGNRYNKNKNNDKAPTSGRVCGDPCPPCVEKCLNRCPHRSCNQKCRDPCSVEPCNERCQKVLPCGIKKNKNKSNKSNKGKGKVKEEEENTETEEQHLCIGVCGEECLQICKICNHEKVEEIREVFFGTEEDEDAMFIQLKDCGHIFEVSGLDQWIQSKLPSNDENTIEIVEISCPRCKTPIRRSRRYINLLNQRAADIEQIKHRIRGLTIEERKLEQAKFASELAKIPLKLINTDNRTVIFEFQKDFMDETPTLMTKTWFTVGRNLLKIVEKLLEYHNRAYQQFHPNLSQIAPTHSPAPNAENVHYCTEIKKRLQISGFMKSINQEFHSLMARIDMKNVSETIIEQLNNEVSRFGFITEIYIYLLKLKKSSNGIKIDDIRALYRTLLDAFENKDFKEDHEKKLWSDFKNVVQNHQVEGYGISEKERMEIVKALDGAVSKWYKCPNGHMYGIGECGQAMVATKCPECGTAIGGQNHQLQAGNSDATDEMRRGLGALHIPDPFVVREGPEW